MRKALIIISPGFPASEEDSTCIPPQQTFVQTLQRLYPERQIIVLSLVYPFFSGQYQWHNVKVIAFGKPGAGRVHRKLTYLRAWKAMADLRNQYELEGILAFWLGPAAWLAARFARHVHLPFYTWLLGQDAREGNKYVKKIKPAAGSLIALSDAVAAEFEKNYGLKPAWVVPPGIDPQLFPPAETEKDLDLVGVGSLIPLKRYELFIDLLSRLKKRFPELRATICGDGPQRAALMRQTEKSGLSEPLLRFTGRLSHPEVLRTMQRARILLHPSAYEGFGVVCLEALHAGASVVSFVRPMNRPVDGWFAVTNPEEMEQVLIRLLEAPRSKAIPRTPFLLEDSARAINQFFDSSSARDPRTGSYLAAPASAAISEPGNRPVAIS